jgi:predicted nicotinamide N-methyase
MTIHSLTRHVLYVLRGRESDWEGLPGTFDCLIAADCVYTDTCVPELLRTMYAIATEDTQVLVAFQEHNPDASRAFWALVEDYFTFQRVPMHWRRCPLHNTTL